MSLPTNWTPSDLASLVEPKVIGQRQALREVRTALYTNKLQIDAVRRGEQDDFGPKSNVFVAGPSGTGKTHLLSTTAKMAGVPFVQKSAKNLTPKGYVGDSMNTLCEALIQAADGDMELAQFGIIFIDEVDKLVLTSKCGGQANAVGGASVIHDLLTFIEGQTPVTLYENTENETQFTPWGVTIVFAGASVGIDYEAFARGGLDEREQILLDYGYGVEFLGRIDTLSSTMPFSYEESFDFAELTLQHDPNLFRASYATELTFSDSIVEHVARLSRVNGRKPKKWLKEQIDPLYDNAKETRTYDRLHLELRPGPNPEMFIDESRSSKGSAWDKLKSKLQAATTRTRPTQASNAQAPSVEQPRASHAHNDTPNAVCNTDAEFATQISSAQQQLQRAYENANDAVFPQKWFAVRNFRRLIDQHEGTLAEFRDCSNHLKNRRDQVLGYNNQRRLKLTGEVRATHRRYLVWGIPLLLLCWFSSGFFGSRDREPNTYTRDSTVIRESPSPSISVPESLTRSPSTRQAPPKTFSIMTVFDDDGGDVPQWWKESRTKSLTIPLPAGGP